MTVEEFVIATEAYYGKYDRQQVKAAVLMYIRKFTQEEIQNIYDHLILEFSNQYKAIPDVAAIEKIRRCLREDRGDGVYRNGQRIGYMDGGRFIPDLSLLSSAAFEKYVQEYSFHDNPQGFLQLIEEDRRGQLVIVGQGVSRK